ncbi:Rpn family recombination-promoting nuclease/putative transposase [bacterium]|nr:Rpn family recombination-promoting nuclease/putative transposase [bacterium]MBU1614091.1 Rpn family recombination-promoting nuclease/putative transposase [bacterium]
MNRITNPHDKFFKEVFNRRETAKEFLLNYLPDKEGKGTEVKRGEKRNPTVRKDITS